ncbi:MAG: hypothetical protein R3195_07955 [Gemmatimonadota bacterium]|nr:hypothetical protein [Gemmatimonadota bacterium]
MGDEGRWDRIDRLFARALEQPDSDRSAFLQAACRGDDALERTVRSLLTAAAESGSFWRDASRLRSSVWRDVRSRRDEV